MSELNITRLRELHTTINDLEVHPFTAEGNAHELAHAVPALLDEVERLRAELVVTQRALSMNSAEVAETRAERAALVEKAVVWLVDNAESYASVHYYTEALAADFRAYRAKATK